MVSRVREPSQARVACPEAIRGYSSSPVALGLQDLDEAVESRADAARSGHSHGGHDADYLAADRLEAIALTSANEDDGVAVI